jgi:hypothetical protein
LTSENRGPCSAHRQVVVTYHLSQVGLVLSLIAP